MQTSISKIFCFGYGYTARHLASYLRGIKGGKDIAIYGTRQNLVAPDVFLYNPLHELDDAACSILQQADAVLISIPPDAQGDPVYRQYAEFLSYMPHLKWVGYCSTTSVYGDHRGGWVDEQTAVNPLHVRARHRVLAEQQWLGTKLPVHIFRLGGIYGAGRSALEQARDGMRLVSKPDHVMNRIHVQDAVRALYASMCYPSSGAIYNLVDALPAPREDVLRYAYDIQGLPVPETVPWHEANLSATARDYFEECKRVKSDKVRQELNLEWLYPDYRSGLDALWNAETPSLQNDAEEEDGDLFIARRQNGV